MDLPELDDRWWAKLQESKKYDISFRYHTRKVEHRSAFGGYAVLIAYVIVSASLSFKGPPLLLGCRIRV